MTGSAPGLRFWERVYRILLYALPAKFRSELGSELNETFRDTYAAEFETGGSGSAWRFAVVAFLRVITCAVTMRTGRVNHRASNLPPRRRPSLPNVLSNVVQDARGGLRSFVRTPAFSLTAVLIAGLGIGAATMVFTIVDRVLIRTLPYADAHRLVYFTDPSHSVPDFLDWRDRTSAFESIVGSRVLNYDLTSEERPQSTRTALVTDGFFSMFGARPILGTLFGEDVGGTLGQPVVVSHNFWQSTLGTDSNIVGRGITLNGESMVITGVMSPEFPLPEPMVGRQVDAWIPFDLTDPELHQRGYFVLRATARLSPTETVESAQAQLTVLAEALATEHPDRYRREDGTARAERIILLQEATVTSVASTLQMLMGAVTLMLLIACANVANLFLARGTDRQREITLRVALGASSRRVLSQVLTETMVLAGTGGLLGVGLAALGVSLFVRTNPVGVPRLAGTTIDLRVLLFAIGTTMITGIVFGIIPALQSSRSNPANALKRRGCSTPPRGSPVRNALVVTEIAMALVLVTGATVLFNNLIALQRIEPGINVEELTAVPIALASKTPQERATFSRDVIERLASLPSVTAVGAGVTIPFAVTRGGRCCWFMDFARPSVDQPPAPAVVHPITEGYFAALGASVLRGRNVTARDSDVEPLPVVVNSTLARRLFGDDDPIGERIDMEGTAVAVVGVVNDIRHWGLDEPIENEVYFPFSGHGEHFFRYYLAIRASSPAGSLAPAIRETIWSVDPEIPLDAVIPMTEWVRGSITPTRFYSTVMAGFAVLALVLAACGIYGSMLYSVGQQYRELGVRLAIGARPVDVTGLVLRRAMIVTGLGLGIGLIAATLLARTLEHLVVGVSASDATSLMSAAILLGTVSLAASYVPARKAAKADPIATLRGE